MPACSRAIDASIRRTRSSSCFRSSRHRARTTTARSQSSPRFLTGKQLTNSSRSRSDGGDAGNHPISFRNEVLHGVHAMPSSPLTMVCRASASTIPSATVKAPTLRAAAVRG